MEPESRIDETPVPPGVISEPEETAALSALSADTGEDEVYTFPASFAQQRLWFLDRLDPGSPAYNLYNPLLLAGELRVDVLGRTLDEIVARHETLRTIFATQQGEPVQVITPEAEVRLPLIDLTALPPERRGSELAALSAAEERRSFDLARGPLLRVTLVRLGATEHAVLFNLHHIVGDGWSMSVLVREVGALYTAFAAGEPSPLPDLPLQYADFAQAQREWLQGEVLAEQLAYWRQQLAGLASLELPIDRPRPAMRTTRGGGLGILLPADAAAPLAELARRHGTTLFVVLLAGAQTLLHRYTGSDDVAVGTVVAGRNHVDTEGMIGFFVNTLVMRTDLTGAPSFDELLVRAHTAALGAFAHQDLPFERLVEELQPQRDLARAPFFDVLLMLQNTPSRAVELPALSLHPLAGGGAGAALFDWMFNAVESDDALILSLTYSLDLFTSTTAGRALQHLGNLLRAATAAPGTRIDDLPLLDAGERAQVLVEWNDTRQVPAWETPVHELFRAQVERTPDRAALEWGDGVWSAVWSYGGLARRAGRLARRLRTWGVGPDVPVGVCAGRGPDLAAALLAILEAGGVYLPLDPAYPRDRLAYMMEDAGASVVLVEERCRGSLPAAAAARLVPLGGLGGPEEGEADGGEAPPAAVEPDHLAYVVYTSGSTGRPKGMGQTHRTLSNIACWQIAHSLGAGATAKTLQFSSTSFDVSLQETFATWCASGTLVPAPEEARRDPALLLRLLTEAGVERLFLPYVALQQLAEAVEAAQEEIPLSLREVLTAGERLRVTPQIVSLFARSGAVLRNQYGPSETHVMTDFILAGDPASWPPLPPIGHAIGDTQTYLLDRSLQPVPVGVTGELAVGGVSLARGYIGRPDLTAERFIPDGFGELPGARLYLTGDLARWRGDGEVEFLGRVDHQVKIRGFRVEPGEIETLLGRHPAVGACTVVAREERAGFPRLIAYVVGRDSFAPSSAELRTLLRQELPDYMVPSAFVMLPALPLTATGKVDRRRLPAPEGERGEAMEAVFVAPRDLLEEGIAGVWRDVLGLERIGIHDVFFELGGHSLSATRVTSRLRAAFGTDLPLRALFESPTVAGLADQIRRELRRDEGTEAPPLTSGAADPAGAVGAAGDYRAPLSFAQQRLWFLDRLEPGSTVYNLRTAVRLGGGLDLTAFTRALGEVVRRHDTLRTRLVEEEGEPTQVVAPAAAAESYVLPLADLTGLAEGAGAEAERLAAELTGLPFDLARGPLFRPAMLRLSDSFVLVAAMHHVVSDAWSMGILVRELAALYEAYRAGLPSPLPELPVQYSDFARWQRRWLSGEVLAVELAWWRQRLAGLPARLELPTDRPRPPVQTLRGTARFFQIRSELGQGIAALALHEKATPFMVLLAVFQALMSRWSGQEDFAVGTPIAGRTRVEVEELIGFFVNNLALRADLGGEPTVRELLARARATALAAYAHQDLPFEKLVEELAPERSLAHSPIFQVVLGLQTAPDGSVSGAGATGEGGAGLEALEMANRTAKYDLLVSLAHAGAGFAGLAEYNTDLFDDATIGSLLEHFETLLAAAVADPGQRLLEAPLLSPAERRQTLEEWSGTVTAYPRQATVHRLFEEQADLQPDAVALSAPEGEISYGELETRANRLAHALREAGVGPEVLVGLCAERSADLVTGMLAILKAGGAYVPLDPSYPLERLAFLLDDAFMPVVLAQERVADRLPAGPMTRLMLLDAPEEDPVGGIWSDARPEPAALAESPVYVLYTSGSTGEPKGVMAVHRGVVRLVRETDFARFGPEEVFLQLAPVSFDASTLEIWGPLLNGGRLVLPPPGPTSLAELGGLLAAHGVTTLWLTAGLFHEMVDSRLTGLAPVRQLLAGGDVLSPVHVLRALAGLSGTRLINGYGPTEGTTFTCCHTMTGAADVGPTVSIGRPIANTTVHLLDRRGLPVPPGVAGELAIGGDGLARGYLNRPGATAERWRPDGTSGKPGERLYHSGDLARYLPDGRIEFFGRIDQQVKIRGFRIEPGEVEAALARHSAVRESVVMAREDRPGDRRLVAYVVTGGPAGEDLERELRAFLGERLPAHLVPAHVVFLAALPLTPNGKVDRRALPAPDAAGPGAAAGVAPRDAVEEELAAVWSEVLGRSPIGVYDNFFELGGHSLLAVRVISQVRDRFGLELPLRTLFEEPTVASLAIHLRQADRAAAPALEAPPLRPLLRNLRPGEEEVFPLSFAQQRLWFLDRLEPESAVYNMPLVVQLEGFLDAGVLERSLAEIIRRHETLRTTFRLAAGTGGEGVQAVSPPADFSLPIVDFGGLAEAALPEVRRVINDDARRPFDLERGPLFRPRLVRLAANDHVVLASMHHIISDGWSLSVLVRELVALYEAFAAGRPSPLPELPLQYADYSVWQRNWLSGEVLEAEIAWWRERLAGLPPSLELPTDRPRPAVQTYTGSVRPVWLRAETASSLSEMALTSGGTLFMALLAAFQALLARWAGQEDFALGSPVAGRNRSELEGLVGFFVNTLVLRADLAGAPGFRELLERTRRRTLEAYAHQEMPFEKLVEELRPERSLAYPPIFQVVFALQNTPDAGLDLAGLRVTSTGWGETRTAKFDLTLSLGGTGDGLLGSLEHNTDLFDAATIDRLIGHLERLITAAVADPETPLAALPLLTAAEQDQLLHEWTEWNAGKADDEERPPARLVGLARWLPDGGAELPGGDFLRRQTAAPILVFAGEPRLTRVAPRTPTEELLAGLWSQLLGREPVGVHDHFFELGGHSLLAMRLGSRIADLFGLDLPLRLIFESPTVEELAGRIDDLLGAEAGKLVPPILPAPRAGHLPLSFAQERLWFLDRLEPGQAVYNVPFSVRLTGGAEPRVLAAALTEVVRRHEVLRTVFPLFEGRPYQEISPPAAAPLLQVDLRGLPLARRGAEAGARLSVEALRPFDLARGPLLRPLIFLLDEGDLVLFLGLHHSISDGWSMGVLQTELTALYAAFSRGLPSPLPELPVQYADFAVWQRQWLAGEELERQIAFWRHQLAGAPGLLELPTDRPRPPVQSFRGASLSLVLPVATARALQTLGRRRGSTIFMTMLAAFQTLLHRLSGQAVIPVGTPVANRNRGEIERLIGCFVNTLVLPADLGDDPPFAELLARVRETSLEAHAHQDLPFEKLVEALEPERSLSHSPLFQVMLTFQNLPEADVAEGVGGLGMQLVETPLGLAKFDLNLTLMEVAGTLAGALTYATDLFDAVTALRLTDQLAALLAAVAEQPEVRPSELPLLTAAQRQQLVLEWNEQPAAAASGRCLHGFVEAQVDRTPEAVAIRFGDERLAYDGLDAQANRLAHRLRRWGVGPEVPVAVFMDRSLEMVVALLGVLKAGGAYVPLDPSWPRERVAFMLADCQAPVLLTQDWLVERLPEAAPSRRLALDPSFEILEDEDETRPAAPAAPASLAYVIYTSGSTGTPKGVAITHASAAALLEWAAREFTAGELAGTLASTSICFDLSVFELFVPLSRGGCVLLVENALSLLETEGVVGGQPVTLINTVPSAAAELVRAAPLPPSVVTVNLAGEPILPGLVLQLHSQPGLRRLLNLYGPSEDTTYSTIEETAPPANLDGAVPPAIGRPLPGTRAYVLDARLAPTPPGAPGELYLGGRGLARGYFRRPELTADRFVPDPFAAATGGTGERLYRTGDRARHLADGRLEFLGRVDHQIKLRGFRIELGEIESALALHPGVRQAVAAVRERGIVAWYEPDPDQVSEASERAPEAPELRDWLAARLPSYMLPAALVPLAALPLTPTGKIDRRALPDADSGETAGGVAPRDALELALVQLWEEVLGRGPVGVHDDFFQLGGHSLLAVRLLALVRERFGRDLPLASLFRAPTIEQLALMLRVQQTPAAEGERGALVEITPPRPDRRALFCVHPVGGNVLCYFDLARALGPDQPFYGLQLPSVPALRSIEEMAAHYLEAVRAVQPQGPYLLAGWSIGGTVAFEMARQLAMMGTMGTAGEETSLLVLIDTPRPFREWEVWEVDEPRLISLFAQDLAATQGRDFTVTMSVAELLELPPDERLQRVLAEAQAARLLPPGISGAEAERLFAMYRTIQEAVKKYRPGSWPGRAVALLATDRALGEQEDPAAGWPELITGGLAVERIEGDHYSILRRPGVNDLAARLAAHLSSSGSEGGEA